MSSIEDVLAQLVRDLASSREKHENLQECIYEELSATQIQIKEQQQEMQEQQQKIDALSTEVFRLSSHKSSIDSVDEKSVAGSSPSVYESSQSREATATPLEPRYTDAQEIMDSQRENLDDDEKRTPPWEDYTLSPTPVKSCPTNTEVPEDERYCAASSSASHTLTDSSSRDHLGSDCGINLRKRKFVDYTRDHDSSSEFDDNEKNQDVPAVPDITELVSKLDENHSGGATSSLETQLTELRDANVQLQTSLDDAHSRIIDIQPVEMGVTESGAASAYRALVGNVGTWINDNLCDHLVSSQSSPKILSLYPKNNAKRMRSCQDLFLLLPKSNGFNADDPALEYYHFITIIMNFLKDNVFSSTLFGVLDEEDDDFITSLHDQMSAPTSKRTMANCRLWWTETMQAVMKRKDFTSESHKRQVELSRSLAQILIVTTIKKDTDLLAFAVSIFRAIIQPAISLACDLELSEFEVDISWTDISEERSSRQTLPKSAYSHWEFVNKDAHFKVVVPKPDGSGARYNYIAEAVPGLWCTRTNGNKKWIVKPQVLVEQGGGSMRRHNKDDKVAPSIFTLLRNKMAHEERSRSR